MAPLKVVVVGNPYGKFVEVLSKLETLHKKNNFSFGIIAGDLFSEPSPSDDGDEKADEDIQRLLRGEITVPLPVYFSLGRAGLPKAVQERVDASAGEVCENLFFLGKRATLTTSDGAKIVCLGGRLDANIGSQSKEQYLPWYSEQDASVLKGANNADVLLTYEWPEGVVNGSTKGASLEGEGGVKAISKLVEGLRPRYHFVCATGRGDGDEGSGTVFYEREPYRNDVKEKDPLGSQATVTRFIALADYGNTAKAKALYAFNLNLEDANTTLPPDVTPCPYASSGRKRQHEESAGASNFFWGGSHSHDGGHRGGRGGKRGRHDRHDRGGPRPPPGPDSCFFCLSNPNLAKHLITSIGSEAYLTTAKGPLTTTSSNGAGMNKFSGHILIIPFAHSPTLNAIEDPESKRDTLNEMKKYKKALETMYWLKGCGTVTFEIARKAGVHTHWQVVPVRKDAIGDVEEAFRKAADEEAAVEGVEEREAADTEEQDYFRVWISGADGEGSQKALFMPLNEKVRFDMQFGRKVLAGVLDLLDRLSWKDCSQSVDDETREAEAFKKAFEVYDFSLE